MRRFLFFFACLPLLAHAQFGGGNGRGDVAVLVTPTPIVSNIFSGGDGRGDIAAVFAPTPIASSIFSGGNGHGDIAAVFAPTPIASSIFSGGNGRGDIAAVFAPTPIASSIFAGGNGRGDIAAVFAPAPIASSIFSGGNGRGDVAALFLPTTIPSNIYSGGIGRGDIAQLFNVGADTYYSRANGNVTDPIWSTWRTGAPGQAIWGPGSNMVVQVGNTVTNTANVSVQKVDVETGGALVLNSNTTFSVWGNNATFTGTLTTQDNSTLALRSTTTPVALATTGTPSLFDLTVNTGGGTTVTGNADIRGTLLLEKGAFNASAAAITLRSTDTYTGRLGPVASVASYVGNLKMERYIPAGATNWRLFGSPIQNRDVVHLQDDFFTAGYPGSAYPNFFDPVGSNIFWPSIRWYDETNTFPHVDSGMVGVSSHLQDLVPGQGFAAWCGDNLQTTNAFVVDLGNAPPVVAQAPVALPMSYTNTGNPGIDGWNLVANPLPSPIAFDQIARGADVDDVVYFYNPAQGNIAYWQVSPPMSLNGGTNVIQSMQGFFLKAAGTAVTTTVDESDKIPGYGGGFFGLQAGDMALRLGITSAINDFSDEAVVMFHAGAPHLEASDAMKLYYADKRAPQVATLTPTGDLLAINGYGTDSVVHIPVSVNAGVSGTYTITLNEVGEIGLTCITLEDLETGAITPLNGSTEYSFTLNANDDHTIARFMLHGTVPYTLNTTDALCGAVPNGSATAVIGGGSADVAWMDAAGNVLLTQNNVSGEATLDGLGAGEYTVNVSGNNACGALVQNFFIEAPPAIGLAAATTPATCGNTDDGSVSVDVMGGIAPLAYLWSDGSVNEDLVAAAGNYSLTITDANGCQFTSDTYEITHGGPQAGFTSEPDVLVNEPLTFTNTSVDGDDFAWDFGDGDTSTDSDPEHAWSTPGTYTVSLTVTTNGCSDTWSQVILVETTTVIATAPPAADLHAWFAYDQFIIVHAFENGLPVVVELLDAAGRLHRTQQEAGRPGRITMPACDLATGIWLIRITNADTQRTMRIPLLR